MPQIANSMASIKVPELSDADYRKLVSKALTRVRMKMLFAILLLKCLFFQSVDMSSEMVSECMEIITMSVDKHQATKNYEVM